jgi:hypothetical protein
MSYDVRIEQHASQPLAVVRRRASIAELPKVIPAACGEVWNLVRARNIAGAGRHIAVYWDGDINLDIGVELAAPIASSDGLLASATPAGPVSAARRGARGDPGVVPAERPRLGGAELGDLRALEGRVEQRSEPDPDGRVLPAARLRGGRRLTIR